MCRLFRQRTSLRRARLKSSCRIHVCPPKRTGRIRRACRFFARWRCERHTKSYSAACATTPSRCPGPVPADAAFRQTPRALRHFSYLVPVQFPPTATLGAARLRGFTTGATIKLRTSTQRWTATPRCPPLLLAGSESAVHHPFRRHSTYSADTTPEVVSGLYDAVCVSEASRPGPRFASQMHSVADCPARGHLEVTPHTRALRLALLIAPFASEREVCDPPLRPPGWTAGRWHRSLRPDAPCERTLGGVLTPRHHQLPPQWRYHQRWTPLRQRCRHALAWVVQESFRGPRVGGAALRSRMLAAYSGGGS